MKNNIPSHSRNIRKVFMTIETVKPHGGTIGLQSIRDVTVGLVHNQILNNMSSMKLLPLLAVVIVLTTQAFACNYDRINRDPNYAEISKPKRVISVTRPQGICVAPNGDFAVVSNPKAYTVKVQIYYSCGKLMKAIDFTKAGFGTDCTFTSSHLYIVESGYGKVRKLSMTGELVKVFHSRLYYHVTWCKNELFFTTGGRSRDNVVVLDGNGKELRTFKIPDNLRGILVGIDGYLYISTVGSNSRRVHKYTKQGKQVGVTRYNFYPDGIAMDSAGNLIIAHHTGGKVDVYSPCGGLIKTIQVGIIRKGRLRDVEIGNDGTVIVADQAENKVFLF